VGRSTDLSVTMVDVDIAKLASVLGKLGLTIDDIDIGVPIAPVMEAEDKARLWAAIKSGKQALAIWRHHFPRAMASSITLKG
jgi:hypothetical protein